jgi:hypothetical protein
LRVVGILRLRWWAHSYGGWLLSENRVSSVLEVADRV